MRPPTPAECRSCGWPIRAHSAPPDGRAVHRGHGLCVMCYSRARRARAQEASGPPRSRPSDLVIEDAEWLARQGETIESAAKRVGMTATAMERALYRAARHDIVRALAANRGR